MCITLLFLGSFFVYGWIYLSFSAVGYFGCAATCSPWIWRNCKVALYSQKRRRYGRPFSMNSVILTCPSTSFAFSFAFTVFLCHFRLPCCFHFGFHFPFAFPPFFLSPFSFFPASDDNFQKWLALATKHGGASRVTTLKNLITQIHQELQRLIPEKPLAIPSVDFV